MKYLDLRRLCAALLVVLATGCASADPEPESAFQDLPEQAYPFDVIFESIAQAVQKEGFDITANHRQGDEAEFKTDVKISGKDKITGEEEGKRVRVRVAPSGDKFSLSMAASTLQRPTSADPWKFKERDAALHEKIEQGLAGIITHRYQGGDGD